ncbi:MAG: MATE family efflux transporter [Synergistaceae bacterium]|nr:MATE family efflux transporter [Synergistaceae bacterium]
MRRFQLSDHFNILSIILFALPSIGMELVGNTYQIADGYFISNYIGSSAFAAENLIFPPLILVGGIGLMFGSGSTALISNVLGRGDKERANRLLTFTILSLVVMGVLLSLGLFVLMPRLARFLGADETLIYYCLEYGRILAVCMPFYMLNAALHPLLITAERPDVGLIVSVINACTNIFLDWFMIVVMGWGMSGAALATGLTWIVSSAIPIIFFMKQKDTLHFAKPEWNFKELLQTCYNGSSEMMNVISYAITAMLFNSALIYYAGENGVAAYSVSEYFTAVFVSISYGICLSITPVVGYNSGRKDKNELRSILKNGFIVMLSIGLIMSSLGILFAEYIAGVFVGYNSDLMKLAVEALRIISVAFIFTGITKFSSAFFTGMEDGTSSLIVVSVETFVMPVILVNILPQIFGVTGIWFVSIFSEIIAFIIASLLFMRYKRKEII